MVGSFKLFHDRSTGAATDRSAPIRRAAWLCGALSSLAAGALLAAASGSGIDEIPTVTTADAVTTSTRDGMPPRQRAGADPLTSMVALRSLRFQGRLGGRESLGEFQHVTVAPAPIVEPFVVMIDPGHGGSDPGAKASNGLLEKELTRDIAERVSLYLSEIDDITVLMTRHGDEGLSRSERVGRVRDSDADLVLSLHFNHLPQQEITLVESFYAGARNIAESLVAQRDEQSTSVSLEHDVDLSFTQGSARLAQLVQDRVYGEVSRDNSAALDAGVKQDTLFVLTRSFVPGALVELTCLSNPAEAERLADAGYRSALAAALADAVRDYRRSVEEHPLGDLEA